MFRSRTLPAALAVAALAGAAVAAAPTAATTDVLVDSAGNVRVVGTLAEPLSTVTIGVDAPDDALGSGTGVDVSEYAVSFPTASTLALHVTLGDANPATGYMPQGLSIEIAPVIDGDLTELTVNSTVDAGLRFGAQSCAVNPDTGVNECSTTPVEGSYEDGTLTWLLPIAEKPGATINGQYVHSNYYVGTGATGGVTFVNGLLDDMTINAFAVLPEATLLVDGEVADTSPLSDAGYALDAAGLAPGEHTLSVELCGGTADIDGNATECTTIDLDPITVAGESGGTDPGTEPTA